MATKSKHTPGPWAVGMRSGANGCSIFDRSGKDQYEDKHIATVSGLYVNTPVDKQPDNISLENAKLIAKAPELLTRLEKAEEFLKEFVTQMQYHIDSVSCENTEKLLGWNQKLVNQVKQFLEGK